MTALVIGQRPGRAVRRRVVIAFALLFVVSAFGVSAAVVGAIGLRPFGADWPFTASSRLDGSLAVGLPAGFAIVLATLLVSMARRIDGELRLLEHERAGLQQAYDRARLDALRDGLTGLGNHRAFQEELDAQVAAARDAKVPLAVLMLDVDDLKTVNDAKGHVAGDDLLRATAQVLRANARRDDRSFRIGGDEFALILPGLDGAAAELVANHLLAGALSGNQGGVGSFSITIGVAAFPSPSADRQQLVVHADAALYSGKRHGRTTVERFDPDRHGMAEDDRALPELAAAVMRVTGPGMLRPVYQPIHDLRTGRIAGFEGLVRPAADSGFDNATALFVAAEATSRTVELDVASARAVLAGASALEPGHYLSINLSPRTLESEAFSPLELLALARRARVPEDRLVIELTEREEVQDLARLRSTLAAFRKRGVRIAVDDVGAGNAGLRLLTEIEWDVMKVDLSLVRAGAKDGASEAVLRALVDLARSRGRTVVAEGIETADQLEAVLELRFDAGQGYLFARPAPNLATASVDLLAMLSGDAGEASAA